MGYTGAAPLLHLLLWGEMCAPSFCRQEREYSLSPSSAAPPSISLFLFIRPQSVFCNVELIFITFWTPSSFLFPLAFEIGLHCKLDLLRK
jgi:hypothetical protein